MFYSYTQESSDLSKVYGRWPWRFDESAHFSIEDGSLFIHVKEDKHYVKGFEAADFSLGFTRMIGNLFINTEKNRLTEDWDDHHFLLGV